MLLYVTVMYYHISVLFCLVMSITCLLFTTSRYPGRPYTEGIPTVGSGRVFMFCRQCWRRSRQLMENLRGGIRATHRSKVLPSMLVSVIAFTLCSNSIAFTEYTKISQRLKNMNLFFLPHAIYPVASLRFNLGIPILVR